MARICEPKKLFPYQKLKLLTFLKMLLEDLPTLIGIIPMVRMRKEPADTSPCPKVFSTGGWAGLVSTT
jgi:hypothetical protein